jgi:hypothetical protein
MEQLEYTPMEQQEYTIDTQPITANVKCGLFSSPVYVYYILHYTSKATWHVQIDPNHYDKNCKCYSKDPYKLIPNEIAKAKAIILERMKNQLSISRITEKNNIKKQTDAIIVKKTVPG